MKKKKKAKSEEEMDKSGWERKTDSEIATETARGWEQRQMRNKVFVR